MPCPRGRARSAQLLARSAGLALAVYGGSSFLPRAFEEGIAAAQAAGPQKVLVSVFLDGGADSLSMLFPDGDPLYRKLRPRLALPASAGLPFAEDGRLRWHPSLAGLAQLHGEGKVAVMPASATRPRPVALHLPPLLGGRRDERAAPTGWLGRYLDRAGTPDNPLQGLSLDWRLQPALASAKMPVASIDGPDQYGFWARNVWGDVEKRMLDAIGALGSLPTGGDAALAQATSAARQSARLREQLLRSRPRTTSRATRAPSPTRRATTSSRAASPASPRCSAPACRSASSLSAPGMYDTHDDQPQELADGLKLTAESLLAFQRDLEARGLADRVLVHVWSSSAGARRRTARTGPTTVLPAPAS